MFWFKNKKEQISALSKSDEFINKVDEIVESIPLSNINNGNKKGIYTKEEIYNAFIAKSVIFMQLLSESKETVLNETDKKRLNMELTELRKCGLVNSKNFTKILEIIDNDKKIIDRIEKANHVLNFIKYLEEQFELNPILLPLSDFISLIDKYNLVCGDIERYTGSIPEKNILELKKINKAFNSIQSNRLTNKNKYSFYSESGSYQFNDLDTIDGKPLYDYGNISDNTIFKYKKVSRVESLQRSTEIRDSFVDMINRFPYIPTHLSYESWLEQTMPDNAKYTSKKYLDACNIYTEYEIHNTLIAAHFSEMKDASVTKGLIPDDPFIFSVTDIGVIILSMWGKESDDELLQKIKSIRYEIQK